MSTRRTCRVSVHNATDGQARIALYHNNSSYGTQHQTWDVKPGETSGALTIPFDTGFGSWGVLDYWAVEMVVTGGSAPGVYASSGVLRVSDWKECQLQSKDADQSIVFPVSTSELRLPLPSGGCSTPMNRVQQRTASAYVTNDTDGHATITLYHNNSSSGTQSASWGAAPGERVGPLVVPFRVGIDSALILDWWAIELAVADGSRPGVYQSSGFASLSDWKECQLQQADADKDLPLSVNTSTFDINLPSGGCSTSMDRVGNYAKVGHVFVLMLENHSFDNVFGFSGIPGVRGVDSTDSNSYDGKTYAVGPPGAPTAMPTDPGHEFLDVYEQLIGPGEKRQPWTPYPDQIVNSGFVSNYATTKTEITKNNPRLPTPSEFGEVMQCFDTPKQLPVMHQLATEFAICDQWFASIPGPTWPNRFFVHGASSAGWGDSPETATILKWMTPGFGFTYPSGASIYDRLNDANAGWRIYVDENGPIAGGVPQVAALKGITYKIDTHAFSGFAEDLQGPYPYTYTFIEPNYGDVSGGSYEGGSSQHPMDGTARGEDLVKRTYEAIRNSPLWSRSLLIVTYDEHGGFYDSGEPGKAVEPDDGSPRDLSINKGGFLFDHYGVRVPALVVSPLVPKGTVDHTVYDHTSVLATLERLYGLAPLTKRDAAANDVRHLLSLAVPRNDCPASLAAPVADQAVSRLETVTRLETASPELQGNQFTHVAVLAKTDLELARGDEAEMQAIAARVSQITTGAQADAYAREVLLKAHVAQVNQNATPGPHLRGRVDAPVRSESNGAKGSTGRGDGSTMAAVIDRVGDALDVAKRAGRDLYRRLLGQRR